MKEIKVVAGINLIILLIYSVIIHFTYNHDGGLGILIISAFIISIHFIVLLVMAGVASSRKEGDMARAYGLSSGLVLLIGFGTCWGSASI